MELTLGEIEFTLLGGKLVLVLGLALAVIAMVLLLLALYRQRGTTLVAPIIWMILSMALWSFVGVSCLLDQINGWPMNDRIEVQLAELSTFCPALAVLGAKRPQNRAWALVVVSLLAILILPSLPHVLGQGDQKFGHWLMQWFLGALVIVAWLNHLPTRYGIAATVLAIGQGAWVLGNSTVGFWLASLAAIVAVACGRFWPSARKPAGWNRVWLDFRDGYGVVWGLRVMERVSALASAAGAGVNLEWSGFYVVQELPTAAAGTDSNASTSSTPATSEQIRPIEAGVRNLLLKFVSSEWIDMRLQELPSQLAG